MTTRHALLVGIDHYPDSPLETCVNDAAAIARVLARHDDGTSNFDTVTVTSSDVQPVTRAILVDRLGELLSQPTDSDLLFYFSGHGRQTALGTELATVEDDGSPSGVSMDQIAATANRRSHRSFTIILDCCFSGALGEHVPVDGARFGQIQLAKATALLAASREVENAFTGRTYSRFTATLLDGLVGAAADFDGRVTPVALHSLVDATFTQHPDQEPVFKVYSDATVVLRRCSSVVTRSQLRLMRSFFEDQSPDRFATVDGSSQPESAERLLDHVVLGGATVGEEADAMRAYLRSGLVEIELTDAESPAVVLTVRVSERGRHLLRLSRDSVFD